MRDKSIRIPRNSLIVNFARFGDLLQMSPTLVGLKNEHPETRVTLVTSTTFGEVAKLLPGVDRLELVDLDYLIKILSHDLTNLAEAKRYVDELFQRLEGERFDFAANLSAMGASSILIKYLNVPEQRGWIADDQGFRVLGSRWSRLLSTMLSDNNRQYNSFNVVDYFRMMAEVSTAPKRLMLNGLDECSRKGAELLGSFGINDDRFVVVHTGVSQMKRSWRAAHFADFCKKLIEKTGWKIVLTGSGNETLLTGVLAREVNHPNVVDVAGKTDLQSLIGVIKLAKGILTGDTGPLHVAAVTGTPSVSLFVASGWPYETGPYLEGQIVIRPVVPCGPCNPNGACSTLECHDVIPVDSLLHLFLAHLCADHFETETVAEDFRDCYVYRTTFDEFGFFTAKQVNSKYDPHKFLRDCYRKLILNEFEGFGTVNQSTEFISAAAKELADIAERGIKLCDELISGIKNESGNLVSLTDQLERLDDRIEEIANSDDHVGLLARLYKFEKESILGDAVELATLTKSNYADLRNRLLKLNWIVQMTQSSEKALSVVFSS